VTERKRSRKTPCPFNFIAFMSFHQIYFIISTGKNGQYLYAKKEFANKVYGKIIFLKNTWSVGWGSNGSVSIH
jgi:hypothetical protein